MAPLSGGGELERQTEYDQDNILPQPELNPLLNPLLGQHMGRWAEVYFTAAPEDREEAVLALLKELESDAAPKPADSIRRANFTPPDVAAGSVAELPELPPDEPANTSPKSERLAILPKSVTCESCGQAVPETQRFCGMCGASMRGQGSAKPHWTKVSDSVEASTPVPEDKFNQNAANSEWTSQNDINYEPEAEQFRPVEVDELRETVFSFGGNVTEQEPVPYRHRIYVGAALAILMIALLILAYRGAQEWSRSSHPLPQAAPSVSPEPAAQAAAKRDTLPPDRSAPDRPAEPRVGDEGGQRAQADRKVEPKAGDRKVGVLPDTPAPGRAAQRQPIRGTASSVTPVTSALPASSVAANQGNGSEELLVAQRYLNATAGRGRDSSEAAKWLWQSVAKQNGVATLLLSDLYLKGDGVAKNCDQARLLLDAAARKGTPGAGERLRNLQAFGCQ